MDTGHNGTIDVHFGAGNAILDPNVIAELPAGCRVISLERHGASFWAHTGKIATTSSDGCAANFFVKILSGESGKKMVHSEFESMKAIYALTPDFAPRPIAWGRYESLPETHFFLCEFREMHDMMPEPSAFASRLARLHQTSKSPNGRLGFHMTTYSGNLPQMTDWETSWEVFFAKNLRFALDLEVEAKGHDPEFDELVPAIFDKVIPRLLRPLETEGRSVKPCLVHGDLCFYAHNEYEFGQWMPACNKFGEEYLAAYHSVVPISAPEEDYGGRLDLYKLRFNTHVTALFRDNASLRDQMLGDMRDLVPRYGQ
ncbi:hypothetical protein INS49_010160 [Diaporthe citri]|uniref:uncharacterized protein n=1 Tax=Diaporthe citri TaxID=83186 RepID=UPI001C7E98D9|nr:uncharacterized protein INS49_010160 [Diaporthe citri]KAG6361931.1 hypothetical protein INS49_010160 [Diaporthe citri]